MGLLCILGNFLLSVAGSILGNKLEPYIDKLGKRRKRKEPPTHQSKGS
ncbi:MAG: hypothetical protein FWE27_08155 [Defluviitaleaceae bacterium]|nr:hypothetical protein [Defluviitaleaceae bacterium]